MASDHLKENKFIYPLGRQVLLAPIDISQETSLIIIPETAKRPERMDYFVVAIGAEAKRVYPSLEVNMRVIVKKFHYNNIPWDNGEEYILSNVDNIEGIVV